MKTSLLYIINSTNIGGAQIGMVRLLDGLNQSKYDVTLLVLDNRERRKKVDLPSYVNHISLYASPSNSNSYIVKKALAAVRDADVIVGSMYHSSIAARLCSFINSEATIATWQHNSKFKNSYRKRFFNQSLRLNDVILADSVAVQEMLLSETRANDDIVQVVPIAGIDMSDYSKVIHENKEPIQVGTVGSLVKQKNHRMILQVAKKLQNENIRFEIAGGGRLYNSLQTNINKYNLDNIRLLGPIDDVPEFLSNLDIYFQPSHYEGLCITVIEAMASGLPVVGSDVGGIGRNVDHRNTGYLFNPTDADGFSSAIYKLAEASSLREKYGTRARKKVRDNFTQEILITEFERAVQTDQ